MSARDFVYGSKSVVKVHLVSTLFALLHLFIVLHRCLQPGGLHIMGGQSVTIAEEAEVREEEEGAR